MTEKSLLLAASLTSGLMIAHQVGGKAVRDALFLSHFPVTMLPAIMIVAAIVSIAASVVAVRLMAGRGPARVVPLAFGVSAVLQLGEWVLAGVHAPTAAVVVFLHMAALGPILTSGFWSLTSERFDPRSARRVFGRIAAAGALGGVVGGLAGERVAATFGIAGALLLLAALHVACAVLVRRIYGRESHSAQSDAPASIQGITAVARISYVRRLIGVVILTSVGAALMDYVFKSQAAAASARGADLMQIFSWFYMGVSVLAFAVQAGLSTHFLKHAGVGRTVATLPAAVAVGGLGALAIPGLASISLARGLQAVLQNSLFRSGYEVLFAPVPRDVKRATKTLVDVGGERLGDIAGAGLVALTLFLLPATVHAALLVLAVALSFATLWLARRLHHGYVESLEENLLRGDIDVEDLPRDESTTRATLFRTLGSSGWASLPKGMQAAMAAAPAERGEPASAVDALIAELRSGDAALVREALADIPLNDHTLPHVIGLLAWDVAAADATAALRRATPEHLGRLAEALIDPSTAFAIRRRVPRVLAAFPQEEVVRALLEGLSDTRFEVRYRCGRALRRVVDAEPSLVPPAADVFEAVRREASVGRGVWATQRLIDPDRQDSEKSETDEWLRDRASNSLTHVFTLLSLVHSREALRIAFRGLHTDDRVLRGTALEYVESVLPTDVWSSLQPFLDDDRPSELPKRPPETLIAELMRSQNAIELRLRDRDDERV